MAENTWVLNDTIPLPTAQQFAAGAQEAAWGWFGLPMAGEGMLFADGGTAWSQHDWLATLGFGMSELTGAIRIPRPAIVQCAVSHSFSW